MAEDKMFEAIMCLGSYHDIDKKFKFHEWKLGLREDYKQKGCVEYVLQRRSTKKKYRKITEKI